MKTRKTGTSARRSMLRMFGIVQISEPTSPARSPATARSYRPYNAAMAPLLVCLAICAVATALTWLASVVTHEYSWVDRIWSLVPVVYVWVFAVSEAFDVRLVLM